VGLGVSVDLGIELDLGVDLGGVDALAEDGLGGFGPGGHGFQGGNSGYPGFFVVVGLLTEELAGADGVGVATGPFVSQLTQ
jgi:hypothetical protein